MRHNQDNNYVPTVRLTEEMLVWLAIMSPLTLWAEGR